MANGTFSSEVFRSDLEEFAHEARKRAEHLHRECQSADNLGMFWQTLTGYIAKGWVCHIQATWNKRRSDSENGERKGTPP